MADWNQAIQIVQGKILTVDANYVPSIEAAVETSWDLLTRMGDWWFMDMPKPYEIPVVANTDLYTINRQNVGRLLHAANEYNRRIWVYKPRRHFLEYRKGLSDDSGGSVAVFTVTGMVEGKIRIQVYPKPQAADTIYMYYREAGTKANFDRLPKGWLKVVIHLTMSMLAPPKQVNQSRWQAMNLDEDKMATYWLSEMERREGAVEDKELEAIVDPEIDDRLAEIHQL